MRKLVKSMKETIRFIHSADLHLDRPFVGLSKLGYNQIEKIKQGAFLALNRLVDLAINEKVHFVVIVGDVFDQASTTIYAEVKFKQALERLNQKGIHVYVSFGNHDYHQTTEMTFDYLDNVYVFNHQTVSSFTYRSSNGTTVELQGFSYETRHVTEDISLGFSVNQTCDYQVGMLHGSVGTSSEHETYAPFQLNFLRSLNFDYFALGHIHKRQVLSEAPPIVYSGNIQGGSKKESGEKGCYIVELKDNGTTFTFQPLQSIRYETIQVDGISIQTVDDLIHTLRKYLGEQPPNAVLAAEICHPTDALLSLYHAQGFTDVIQLLNEGNDRQAYLIELSVEQPAVTLHQHDPFFQTLTQQFKEESDKSYVDELFQHHRARHFLDELTEDDLVSASDDAFHYLYYQLIGGDNHED